MERIYYVAMAEIVVGAHANCGFSGNILIEICFTADYLLVSSCNASSGWL